VEHIELKSHHRTTAEKILAHPTSHNIEWHDVLSLLSVGALLVLVEALVRRGTASSCSMALLVAASPFTIDYLFVDHRPDLLAIVVLVGVGAVVTRATRAVVPWLVALGVAFGAMVLVHEDVLLIQIPWAIALVALATLGREGVVHGGGGPGVGRELTRRLAALLAAPAVAAVAVVAYGLPSARTVAELRSDVAAYHLGPGTMFAYLPDSIGTSMRLVGSIPPSAKAHTVLLGGILVALQLAWVVAWVRPGIWAPFGRRGNRLLGAVLGAVILVATGVLFATGVDWLRWFADCGTAWLVVQAFAVLLESEHAAPLPSAPVTTPGTTDPAVTGRIGFSLWLPALAVYLVAIPPLDLANTAGLLRHFLFFT